MTLDELTTPMTIAEARAAIYATLEAKGAATSTWKPGAVVRTIIAGVAIVLSALSQLQALIAKLGFLEFSTGDWLVLVARHVYGVEKITGTFASGNVRLDNTGGGVYAGDPGDLVVRNSVTGKTYRNTAAFSIVALETDVIVPVEAVELGTDSNAAPGDISEFETPLLGVTVTNPTAIIGADAESDPQLIARCQAKLGSLSPNGPRDAYHFIATSAVDADGNPIGVTRVRTVPDGVGGVDVYVATASGGVTGTAGDPSTDLGAIADAIHRLVEPLCITPDVQSATAETIALTYEAWVRNTSGLTVAQLEQAVEDHLSTYLGEQPIGGHIKPSEPGRIYKEALEAAIAAALGEAVLIDLDVTVPAGDVALTISQAPVLGTVTVTAIHEVVG